MATMSLLVNAQLELLERERAINLSEQTPLGQVMPWAFEDTDTVLWEVRDNVMGLSLARGIGEPYSEVDDSGVTRYTMLSGHYGETRKLDAARIVRARQPGTFGDAIVITEETSRMMLEMAQREASLVNYIRGRLLALGEINVLDKNGTARYVYNWAGYADQLVTLTSTDVWTDLDDSYPLGSLRDAILAKMPGSGHRFLTPEARAIANPNTWSYVWKNENPGDVAGKRDPYGATITDFGGFQRYVVSQAMLPTPVIDDSGHGAATTDTWAYNIPDGYVVIVGVHESAGIRCGNYVATKHDAAGGRPVIYAEQDWTYDPPKLPRVHRGHSGGPRLNYGRQVIILKAY